MKFLLVFQTRNWAQLTAAVREQEEEEDYDSRHAPRRRHGTGPRTLRFTFQNQKSSVNF